MDDDPTSVLIREGQKKAEKQAREARKLKKEMEIEEKHKRAASQRRQNVDLRRVTSISGSAPEPKKKERYGTSKRRG